MCQIGTKDSLIYFSHKISFSDSCATQSVTPMCSPAGDVSNDCTLHAGALVGRFRIDKYANDGFWRVLQR